MRSSETRRAASGIRRVLIVATGETVPRAPKGALLFGESPSGMAAGYRK